MHHLVIADQDGELRDPNSIFDLFESIPEDYPMENTAEAILAGFSSAVMAAVINTEV